MGLFQRYGFIKKVEPFYLRMKYNIIQMTATAGLTVPHSINLISQYIFDCLGKRSIRLISKIIAFGAQKIQTSSFRSRCTHNEWLVRILVRWHNWAIFLRKWARSRRYGQWRALPCYDERIFVSKNWRGWHGRKWFQQDGATCYTANVTIDLLRTVFENRIISRNSFINWPPQSCDLTPLDYFLSGTVKDKCYANHPEMIEALKHVIKVAIHGIEA